MISYGNVDTSVCTRNNSIRTTLEKKIGSLIKETRKKWMDLSREGEESISLVVEVGLKPESCPWYAAKRDCETATLSQEVAVEKTALFCSHKVASSLISKETRPCNVIMTTFDGTQAVLLD